MQILRGSSAMLVTTLLLGTFGVTSRVAGSGGSVAGKVTLQGQPLKAKTINMSSEPGCAKLYSTPPTTEDVVVGPGGALKNVVVYLSAGAPEQSGPPPEPVTVTQKGCRFAPHIVALQANQEVRVINEDATTHNIHPLAAVNREWNKAQPPGTPPLEETFAREEFISVKCNIHSWMHSYFVVLKTTYYSVSNENGAFTLENLPPGKYTVTAWHEVYGKQTQEVIVSGNQTEPVNFVFKAN
jgi:plastocyanin